MFRLGYTKPLVLFPNETWALTKKTEKELDVYKRKMLERIYGERKEN